MKKENTIISTIIMFMIIICVLISCFQFVLYGNLHYKTFHKMYEKYYVTEELNMKIDDVMNVSEYMMEYLIGKQDHLSVTTNVDGTEKDFFNEQDRAHMKDVRNIFLLCMKVRTVFVVVSAFLILYLFLKKEKVVAGLAKGYKRVLITMLVIATVFGVAIYRDFTTCFTWFHKLVFRNKLWLFDPTTDYMIRMLPEEVFFELTIRIGIVFLVMLVLIDAVLILLGRIRRRFFMH